MEEFGCWQEARRCDLVAIDLARIREDLGLAFFEQTSQLLASVISTSGILRDLHDLFPIYRLRIHLVRNFLTVILPCLQKTLNDMDIYVDIKNTMSAETQWAYLNERMNGQGGQSLVTRFAMYFDFLVQMARLLSSSPFFDPHRLNVLCTRIIKLRLLRNIPAPPAVPHLAAVVPTQQDFERRHWSEKVFEKKPNSTTGLKHRRPSQCFGPPMIPEMLGIGPGSSVLLKLPFNKNRLSVMLYLHAEGADITRLLCRWEDRYSNPNLSCYGVHELCVRRRGASLQFRRWSPQREQSTVWMALFFKTWEKLVLFHAAFVTLKLRCPLTLDVNPSDFNLTGEMKLFQGPIIDDGFEHSLAVFQDKKTGCLRLHAAVWSGELRRCPVWTAFITEQSSAEDWLERRTAHRIWVRDVTPYVFCSRYNKRNQMPRKHVFELYFVTRKGADEFEDLFRDASDGGSLVGGGGGGGG